MIAEVAALGRRYWWARYLLLPAVALLAAGTTGGLDNTGRVAWIEVGWLALGLGCAHVAWDNVRDAYGLLEAANTSPVNGLRRIIAFGWWTDEVLRFGKANVIIIVGVAAMVARPQQHTDDLPVTPSQVVATIGIVLLAGLVLAGAVLSRRRRVRSRLLAQRRSDRA